jgi:hypothetical protein
MQMLGLGVALLVAGCSSFETVAFRPQPGAGRPVTNGEIVGVGIGVPADAPLGSRSRVIIAVKDAYEREHVSGMASTVVHVVADVLNAGDEPGRFDAQRCHLNVRNTGYPPRLVAHWPMDSAASGAVPAGRRVRFDLFYDLGRYDPTVPRSARAGVRLQSLDDITVGWQARLEGQLRGGRVRFTRMSDDEEVEWPGDPKTYLHYGWYTWLLRDLREGIVVTDGSPAHLPTTPPVPARM